VPAPRHRIHRRIQNVATGQVIAEPIGRNNSATFIRFLCLIDRCTDPALSIHLILDNGSSHTSRATRAWLAAHPWASPSPHPSTLPGSA
jgi:transposase